MERVIFWPYMAVEWVYYKIRRWCWPHCLAPRDRLPNVEGDLFPIRLKCRKCGKVTEC